MLRTVLAAIAGFAVIAFLVLFTDQIFILLSQGFQSMPAPPRHYFVFNLIADTICSIAGGYLCATIAARAHRRATLLLIVCGEAIGLVAMIALWKTTPHWFVPALLVICPLAVRIGSRLASRGEPLDAPV